MDFESASEAYYSDTEVVRIIKEYIGYVRYGGPARYIVGSGKALIEQGWTFPVSVQPPSQLSSLIKQRLDLYRSVCSPNYDVYTLDLEYQHPDHLHYLYEHPDEVYKITYPVIEHIYNFLRSKGVDPL
ncbi:MAG: hypothetical protein QW728_06620, partial [Thermoplasmata archaeon]